MSLPVTLSKVCLSLLGKPFAGYVLLAKRLAPGGLGVVCRASGEIHVYSLKAEQIRALPKIQFAATHGRSTVPR